MAEIETAASIPETAPRGVGWVWRRLLADSIAEREIIRTLFRRNFINRFAGSGLGIAWVIIMPCLPVFIYNVLQVMGVFADPGTGLPRAVFMTCGLILYYSFSETIGQVASATVNNRNYIVQSGVPKMAIILSLVVESAANFFIRFAVFMVIFTLVFRIPDWTLALLPLFVVPLIVFALSLGLILNLFCVLYQDVANIVQAATFYLLFASGVFSTIPDTSVFFHILRFSPIYQLITVARAVSLEGDTSGLPNAAIAAGVCFLMLPLALLAFYRAEKLVNSYL